MVFDSPQSMTHEPQDLVLVHNISHREHGHIIVSHITASDCIFLISIEEWLPIHKVEPVGLVGKKKDF